MFDPVFHTTAVKLVTSCKQISYNICLISADGVVILIQVLTRQEHRQNKGMATDRLIHFIFRTGDEWQGIPVRLVVGLIFLSEGIQKFLFPEVLGTGRFEKIGFPDPEFWAYFTGVFEVICGFLVLLGAATRLAGIPLLVIMITAFITTKWPLLQTRGFWVFAHEYRTDFAMTVLLIYLVVFGPGKWSLDHVWRNTIKSGGVQSSRQRSADS